MIDYFRLQIPEMRQSSGRNPIFDDYIFRGEVEVAASIAFPNQTSPMYRHGSSTNLNMKNL